MKYIQNRTNWCWVAACKVAGEQYKKNFTEFAFTLESPETEVAVSNLDGLRTDIVKKKKWNIFCGCVAVSYCQECRLYARRFGGKFSGK